MSVPIPQPPALPFVGNITNVHPDTAIHDLNVLAKKYGEIFKMSIFGKDKYIVSSYEIMNQICDEKNFHKSVDGVLTEVQNGVGTGLFTAPDGDHDWLVAHRTLMPAFGPINMLNMYDEMYDIATQLTAKWARTAGEQINTTDDFTRLALDSIALCAMGKRFNSFYSETLHPFVDSMTRFLLESGRRQKKTKLELLINRGPTKQYEADIALMRSVAQEVMNERRKNPTDKKDLLNALLYGKDPKTGERMSDENIMNNMLTFLIAGHETTSGMLSYTWYYLLKNPEALRKAQEEVDSICGKGPITEQHLKNLPYIEACLREAIRLNSPAPALTITPNANVPGPVVLAGKYYIPQDATIFCLLYACHRDPKCWGPDAEEYKPERMYKENFDNLPPNCWKPFGNGKRACIGRPFAWQEALLIMAMILQNFNLRMDDPSYTLRVKQTLTTKPEGFFMRASLREGVDSVSLEKRLYSNGVEEKEKKAEASIEGTKPMTILYGSNSGTCEGLSQQLAGAAGRHDYKADVRPLDSAATEFPSNQPVVIITSSYEGNPPDNAATFVDSLTHSKDGFKGAKYAVFGCGHRDWVSTFQKIPKLIDTELEAKGAIRIATRGSSDVAAGSVFDDFDSWQDHILWPALSGKKPVDNEVEGIEMEITTNARSSHLRHTVQDALVLKNELLSQPGVPEKRLTQIKLPTNMTYEAGDYLALLPLNNIQTIGRVLKRFGLPWDAVMTLKQGAHTTIPTEKELNISSVLSAYVELSNPASKKNLAVVSKFADEKVRGKIENESGSVLEILEKYPTVNLPFSIYLSMLTPMRIRQYSISSSPLNDPTVASITYSVLDSRGHLGVATNYLKLLQPGSTVQVSIKKSHPSFHLPLDNKIPVIMACAGTGLAPFRGFVEERAAQIAAGNHDMGEAVLFVGCRDPDKDRLYAQQMEEWEKIGAVKVFYAYSRASDKSEGCKYVQDRVYHEKETASRLFKAGARAYICGSSEVGKGLSQAVAKMVVDDGTKGLTHEEALKWWEGMRGERYAVDVFD